MFSHRATEPHGLGRQDAVILLELDEPLVALAGPDVDLLAVLVLVLLGFGLSSLERLQIVDELDLLVEDLLLRVIATEEFRLCKKS